MSGTVSSETDVVSKLSAGAGGVGRELEDTADDAIEDKINDNDEIGILS